MFVYLKDRNGAKRAMRSKQKGIETISVMMLLVLFAFVVFLVIDAGTNAFGSISDDKRSTMSARVAYSYIGMKVKHNDSAGGISVTQTKYGDTLKIESERYSTHIFFCEGGLYECLTKPDTQPNVDAANKITELDGFAISIKGNALSVECVFGSSGKDSIVKGTIGLRSRI